MPYKFEQLDVLNLSLDYMDLIYDVAGKLPKGEEYNLKSQIIRAATSVSLNIAEGSTGQSDAEQARFLGMAIRSLIVSCLSIYHSTKRLCVQEENLLQKAYDASQTLARKLQTFRKSLSDPQHQVREDLPTYGVDDHI
jgi:four helix bundle protein